MARRSKAADAVALVDRYGSSSSRLQDRAVAVGQRMLGQIDDWYDDAVKLAIAQQLASVSTSAEGAARGLAQQYIAAVVTVLSNLSSTSIAPTDMTPVRNGADPLAVFSRPVDLYRRRVSLGATNAEAASSAMDRINRILSSNVTLAERDAATRQMAALGVTRFRRVLRPELSRTGSCGLCIAASDQVYKTAVLMPIHDHCNCKPMPIVGSDDPGKSVNADDLEKIYAAAGSTGAADLKRIRVKVNEHGEFGPVLVDRRHSFRGPDDLGADKRQRARKELAALLPVLESLQKRAAEGEDVSGPLKYQRDRIALLRTIA